MKSILSLLLAVAVLATAAILHAADSPVAKPKPYPFEKCLICGMKFEPGSKPYLFVYKGREIKLCDESEKEDIIKNWDQYVKKFEAAEAAAAKAKK